MPEMVFGENDLSCLFLRTRLRLSFRAIPALSCPMDPSATPKVAAARKWQMANGQSAPPDQVVRSIEYDWTFSTPYTGTLEILDAKGQATPQSVEVVPTEDRIPYDKLKRQDPILFFGEIILFEDELADNGVSLLTAKIRVMPERFFVLLRLWVRIDGVLCRLYDTRLYHEFGDSFVLREIVQREAPVSKIPGGDAKLHDPSQIAELIEIKSQKLEKILLPVSVST
eukprot:TRINITY_DN1554_c0_g1_i2.p1 TRINITY_DN1554_c0_g1~~TRINITY_DN1554_c0_g1_i2.p1  ORF type:complete len:226 (-),score=60.46 TRINITY_DN1554_c0_g1_i2:47-724(-)